MQMTSSPSLSLSRRATPTLPGASKQPQSLRLVKTHAAANQPDLQQAHVFGLVGRTWLQAQLPTPTTPKSLRQQMADAGRSCMAVILPFASTTIAGTGGSMADIYDALAKGIDIYLFILTVRVLMSWFKVNWYTEPFRTLRNFTDPCLNACRGIIPAIGGIDLSPMLLFFGLNFAARQLKIMALTAA